MAQNWGAELGRGTRAQNWGKELAGALIAATPCYHGLEPATLNVKPFPMFKRLKAAH